MRPIMHELGPLVVNIYPGRLKKPTGVLYAE